MEKAASEVVYEDMGEYANETIRSVFPCNIDGLTKGVRRMIWASLPNRASFLPLATILAQTRINHVAGEIPIRKTADNHIQPWKTYIPILDIEGTMGSYSGKIAGATRYLEAALSDMSYDLYFSKVDTNTFPLIQADSGIGKEAIYFIPIIPTALLSNDKGIAPGFRFQCIPININSVCELVKTYVEQKKNNPLLFKRRDLSSDIVKHLIPDPIVPGLIRNLKQVYEGYKKSKFTMSIIIDGMVEVTKTSIVIKTIPSGNILNVKERIEKHELANSNSWFSKHFTSFDDVSGKGWAEHVLTVKRGLEPFKLLEDVKRMYMFTSEQKSFPNWINTKGNKEIMYAPQILEAWYEERYKSILNQLRIRERDIVTSIRKYKALIVASDHPDEIYNAFKGADTPELAAQEVVRLFPELTIVQARYLFEFKYTDLTKLSKEALFSKIEEAQKSLAETKHDILNVDSVVIKHVEFFKGKYIKKTDPEFVYKGCLMDNTIRNVKVPTFSFVCKVRGIGYVQCFNVFEIKEVFRAHGSDIELFSYPNSPDLCKAYIDLSGKLVTEGLLDIPQTFAAKKLYISDKQFTNTVVISEEGTIFGIKGLQHMDDPTKTIFYVGDTYVAVSKNGNIEQFEFKSMSTRKSMNSSGVMSNVIYIHNTSLSELVDYYVIRTNKGITNTVFIDKIVNNKIPSIGNTEDIIYFGKEDDLLLSITDSAVNKTNNKHLFFKGIKNVFKDHDRIHISLSKLIPSNKNVKFAIKSLEGYIKEITVS